MSSPHTRARILWQRLDETGLEWCELSRWADGLVLTGVALVSLAQVAHRIDYSIEVDADGRTNRVWVDAHGGVDRTLELVADGAGTWRRQPDGDIVVRAVDEPAALDVDLGFSPVTNSLPIWRLASALGVGETSAIRVAWVLFPGLDVVEGRQWYTRLADRRWRYQSEAFSAELVLRDDGLVDDYRGLWRAVGRA